MATPTPINQTYFVFQNGEVKGPYELSFIEAMALSGILPPDVTISKDGSVDWERLDVLTQPVPKQNPLPPLPQSRPSVSKPYAEPAPVRAKRNYGCLWVFLGLIGLGVIGNLFNPPAAPRQTYQPPAEAQPTYQPPATQPVYQPPANIQPVYRPPATTVPVYQPTYQPATPQSAYQPAYQPPAPQPRTYSMTGGDGQVYTVSDANYQILLPRKQQLDAWDTKIDRYQTYVDNLGRQVDADRAAMDNTSQESVDNFNAEVDKYNTAREQLKSSIDSYNQAVESFNTDLARVGRLR